jgi:hypothetical protein
MHIVLFIVGLVAMFYVDKAYHALVRGPKYELYKAECDRLTKIREDRELAEKSTRLQLEYDTKYAELCENELSGLDLQRFLDQTCVALLTDLQNKKKEMDAKLDLLQATKRKTVYLYGKKYQEVKPHLKNLRQWWKDSELAFECALAASFAGVDYMHQCMARDALAHSTVSLSCLKAKAEYHATSNAPWHVYQQHRNIAVSEDTVVQT